MSLIDEMKMQQLIDEAWTLEFKIREEIEKCECERERNHMRIDRLLSAKLKAKSRYTRRYDKLWDKLIRAAESRWW